MVLEHTASAVHALRVALEHTVVMLPVPAPHARLERSAVALQALALHVMQEHTALEVLAPALTVIQGNTVEGVNRMHARRVEPKHLPLLFGQQHALPAPCALMGTLRHCHAQPHRIDSAPYAAHVVPTNTDQDVHRLAVVVLVVIVSCA